MLFHKKERKEDFSLFWESVTRNRKDLRKIVVIKLDECPQLHDSIFSQTGNLVYFLGLEHVQKNVEEFLKNSSFPPNVSRGIVKTFLMKQT